MQSEVNFSEVPTTYAIARGADGARQPKILLTFATPVGVNGYIFDPDSAVAFADKIKAEAVKAKVDVIVPPNFDVTKLTRGIGPSEPLDRRPK